MERVKHKLSYAMKLEIATNLIESMADDKRPNENTIAFIDEWVIGGNRFKKSSSDIWNLVLDGFKPIDNPLLYRALEKGKGIHEGKVASYTGRFESAFKFQRDKIIVLNTKEALEWNTPSTAFKFSFYPLYQIFEKHNLFTYWIPEEEYIVRETYGGVKIFTQTYP